MHGRMEFETNINGQRRNQKEHFARSRILILGDFSNRFVSTDQSIDAGIGNDLPIYKIDLDNFDHVLQKINPVVSLTSPMVDQVERLQLRLIEDFHPDRIFDNVSVFKTLKRIKTDIADPEKRSAAAREFDQCFGETLSLLLENSANAANTTHPSSVSGANANSFQDLLERGNKSNSSTHAPLGAESSGNFIEKIISPYVIKDNIEALTAAEKQIESVMAQRMRDILQHAEFKALETTWRSLYNFLCDIEDNDELEFYILPLDKKSLAQILGSPAPSHDQDCAANRLQLRLVDYTEQFDDDQGWTLLLGDYQFEPNARDTDTLLQLGKMAKSLRAPFISAGTAARSLTGDPICEPIREQIGDDTSYWQKMRSTEYARWLSLIGPRFIQRLPYGQDTDAIECFPFQEIENELPHQSLLWGNSSYLAAKMLIQLYLDNDGYPTTTYMQFDDLPAYIYHLHGERLLHPCGELVLDRSLQSRLQGLGINPIISYSNLNSVRLGPIVSLALEATPLVGKWTDSRSVTR